MEKLAVDGGTPVRTKAWPTWPVWDEEDRRRLGEVLDSGEWGGYSPLVPEVEQAFADAFGVKRAVSCPNGSLTLQSALMALRIGPGDEVIVPPYTFIATALAVCMVGATPVFADIQADTLNLDPEAFRAAITERTKAVIPVHFAGLPADMDAINAIAAEHGIAVIEDAAHAHGSSWRGRRVGGLGTVASFSFQASKNMTTGEGGMLTTDDDELAERLWTVGNLGRRRGGGIWYGHPDLGTNHRMSAWVAAVLMGQLGRLDEQLARREASARHLTENLGEGLVPMAVDERVDHHAYHIYVMRYSADAFGGRSREDFVAALAAEGVPASTGYPVTIDKQPGLGFLPTANVPEGDRACQETVWISQKILLGDISDMDDIVTAVAKIRSARQ